MYSIFIQADTGKINDYAAEALILPVETAKVTRNIARKSVQSHYFIVAQLIQKSFIFHVVGIFLARYRKVENFASVNCPLFLDVG